MRTDQECYIAILVAKLGGSVAVTYRDWIDFGRLPVTIINMPEGRSTILTVPMPPPAAIDAEFTVVERTVHLGYDLDMAPCGEACVGDEVSLDFEKVTCKACREGTRTVRIVKPDDRPLTGKHFASMHLDDPLGPEAFELGGHVVDGKLVVTEISLVDYGGYRR